MVQSHSQSDEKQHDEPVKQQGVAPPSASQMMHRRVTPQLLQRAIDNPTLKTLTPDVVRILQRTHGNYFVQRLYQQAQQIDLVQPVLSSAVLVQRADGEEEEEEEQGTGNVQSGVMSLQVWLEYSSLMGHRRSDALKKVDEAVSFYHLAKSDDELALDALHEIRRRIEAWRASGKKHKTRVQKVNTLWKQVSKEIDIVSARLDGGEVQDIAGSEEMFGGESKRFEFSLEELTFKGLSLFLRRLLGSGTTGTGSVSLSFKVKLGVSTGIPDIIGASITPYITIGGGMNIGDDRRLRVGASISFGVESAIDFLKFWKIYGKMEAKIGVGATFEDEQHFAAFLLNAIASMLKGFKNTILGIAKEKNKKLTKEEQQELKRLRLGEEASGDETYQDLATKGASVTSMSLGASAAVGMSYGETVGAEVGASTQKTRFYKDIKDEEGNPVRYKKTGTTTSYSFSVGCAWPGAINLSVAVTRTIITNDANPNNNGDYLNIAIAPGGVQFGEDMQQEFMNNLPTNLSGGSFKEAVESNIANAAKAASIGSTKPPNANIGIQLNYVSRVSPDENKPFLKQVLSGDYFLQYVRFTSDWSQKIAHDFDIPTNVPGLNVTVGLALSLSRSAGLAEFLGTNTLTYIRTVYDGLMNRGQRGAKQWASYRNSSKNSIAWMFTAVANPKTAAYEEVQNYGGEAASAFQDKCLSLVSPEQLQEHTSSEPEGGGGVSREFVLGQYDEILPFFEDFLKEARAKDAAEEKGKWRKVYSGQVKAYVDATTETLKTTLKSLHIDSKSTEELDPEFPHNLKEAYEEGFRNKVVLVGRRFFDNKRIGIEVEYQKPDSPHDKLVDLVEQKMPKFDDFPASLARSDDMFWSTYKLAIGAGMQAFRDTKGSHEKKVKASESATQKFWSGMLATHIRNLMDDILEMQLDKSGLPTFKDSLGRTRVGIPTDQRIHGTFSHTKSRLANLGAKI